MSELSSIDSIGLKYAYDYGKGKNYTGGDKTSLGHGFTKEYEVLFESMRGDKIKLLELGIFHGKSLAMWSEYFVNGSIVGLDIDLETFYDHERELKKYGAFKNQNVSVLEADVTKSDFKEFIEKMSNFNIIIDDAIHVAKYQMNNLMLLFPKLHQGGYYIIEDIVDPIEFYKAFGDLIACISNINVNSVKKSPLYSMATKIDFIKVQKNLIVIKKK